MTTDAELQEGMRSDPELLDRLARHRLGSWLASEPCRTWLRTPLWKEERVQLLRHNLTDGVFNIVATGTGKTISEAIQAAMDEAVGPEPVSTPMLLIGERGYFQQGSYCPLCRGTVRGPQEDCQDPWHVPHPWDLPLA